MDQTNRVLNTNWVIWGTSKKSNSFNIFNLDTNYVHLQIAHDVLGSPNIAASCYGTSELITIKLSRGQKICYPSPDVSWGVLAYILRFLKINLKNENPDIQIYLFMFMKMNVQIFKSSFCGRRMM